MMMDRVGNIENTSYERDSDVIAVWSAIEIVRL